MRQSNYGRNPDERNPSQAQLKQQFPVSSGQQHITLGGVPISPTSPTSPLNEPNSDTDKSNPAADRMPHTDLPQPDRPKINVESAVAQRISSIRQLQENQQDI